MRNILQRLLEGAFPSKRPFVTRRPDIRVNHDRRNFATAIGLVGGTALAGKIDRAAAAPAPIADTSINIRSFGAVGDRLTDDSRSIGNAIAAAERTDQYPLAVRIPSGNYRRASSIALPDRLCLLGDGVSSILNSQNDDNFHAPILVNKKPAGLIGARIKDLSLYGGSHALKLDVSEENADVRLENVTALMQSVANIEANRLFQTAKLSNCVLGSAPFGLRVDGTGTNCFCAVNTEWLDHSEGSVLLRGGDAVTFIGNRFEGGGRKGRYCIDITNSSNITFVGCFFENVHEILARFRNIAGSVSFQSCHFSGTSLGGKALLPFDWDCDDTLVVFRDCVSVVPMPVRGHISLCGENAGLSSTGALYAGSDQAGSMLVQPQPVSRTGSIRLATIEIGQGAPALRPQWRMAAEIELLDPDQPARPIIRLEIDPASRGKVGSNAKYDVVATGAENVLNIDAIPTNPDAFPRRLGFSLRWHIVGPLERAPRIRGFLNNDAARRSAD